MMTPEELEIIRIEVTNNMSITRHVKESNLIEQIKRDPTPGEIEEMKRFINLYEISFDNVIKFVSIYEPKAKLRAKKGMDAFVGDHIPPGGGAGMGYKVMDILSDIEPTKESAFEIHNRYESLHPFTDGNGRSGRAIWLWQMTKFYRHVPKLSFLQTYYYQSLSFCRK